MNDSKEMASTPQKDSELQIILSKFNDELNKYNEYSNIILEKTCKILNYRVSKEPPEKQTDQREGCVGEFDNAILRLRDYNSRLDEIITGLNKIVG